MASVIPRYALFKSNYNNHFVRYNNYQEGWWDYRYLVCDGKDIVSPFSKFRVEQTNNDTALVHIRCCYSNKYWRRTTEDGDNICAAADKPEEDQSKWSCTLFKPIQSPGNAETFRFQHVQSGNYVGSPPDNRPFLTYLHARNSTQQSDGTDLFTLINWESLVILPKYVVFKGDNGKYLRYRGENDDDHMEFACDDIGATKVSNETFMNMDGSIRVKHDFNEKFWKATPNWIYPISTDTSATPETSFWPVKLKNNIIALKSMGNDRFCRRTNYGGTQDCLAAASWATKIDKEANLQVEEPLVLREVYDVDFHLKDARVYNDQIVVMAFDETTNLSDSEIKDSALSLEYEDSRMISYKTSTSVKISAEMGFSATIPIIEDIFTIGISTQYSVEYGKKYAWGMEKKKTNKLSATIKVVVPPKTKVKVELVATKGFCDVPFSYAQRDTLTNGKYITYYKDDGVYTGSNYFGFNFVVKEEQIGA